MNRVRALAAVVIAAGGSLATGAGAFDAHLNLSHAVSHRLTRRVLGDLLRSFLASPALGLQMVEWIGEPLLVDEAGVPAPAGADAFASLLTLDGMLQHVFAAVADANSAKGKLGN